LQKRIVIGMLVIGVIIGLVLGVILLPWMMSLKTPKPEEIVVRHLLKTGEKITLSNITFYYLGCELSSFGYSNIKIGLVVQGGQILELTYSFRGLQVRTIELSQLHLEIVTYDNNYLEFKTSLPVP